MSDYEYKVVPAPSKGRKAKGRKSNADRFAFSVEEVLNEYSAEGWEYLRAELLPSDERSGLTGSTREWRNVLIFRRALPDAAAAAPVEPPVFVAQPDPAPASAPKAEPPVAADPDTPRAPPPLSDRTDTLPPPALSARSKSAPSSPKSDPTSPARPSVKKVRASRQARVTDMAEARRSREQPEPADADPAPDFERGPDFESGSIFDPVPGSDASDGDNLSRLARAVQLAKRKD